VKRDHFDTRGAIRRRESMDDMETQPPNRKQAESQASSRKQQQPAETPATWLQKAEDYARHEPTKAVISAAGAGFLINLLPIGAIVGMLTTLAFAFVRPLLLFLGLLKACEYFNFKPRNNS
jgi:hypothetical protein